MKPDRLKLLSQAFRETPLTCGGLKLRPITAGSMLILMDLGNPLFAGDAEEEEGTGDEHVEATPVETLDALFEFIWVHSAPEEEVLRMLDGDASDVRFAVRKMGLGIGFDDLASFQEQFATIGVRIRAAMTEVVTEGEPGKPAPNLTGLPPISGPSGPVAMPHASDIVSGSSLSNEDSNSSTPPSGLPDSAHGGLVILPTTPPPGATSTNTFLN